MWKVGLEPAQWASQLRIQVQAAQPYPHNRD